jgi:HTH-type transcriptional regulator / antitoxin HipB
MNYSLNTPVQMRAQIRALRQSRQLTQADVGKLLQVSQKRIARIESAPDKISVAQLAQLASALGYQLTLSPLPTSQSGTKGDW